MTPQQFQSVAPILAAGLLLSALVAFLGALRLFRKSRTDLYWRRRRSAGQRGWRLFVSSIVLTFLAGLICLMMGVLGLVMSKIASTATAVPATTAVSLPPTIQLSVTTNVTSTPAVTLTPLPATTSVPVQQVSSTSSATTLPTRTATATATATRTATSTPTPSATRTPSVTPTPTTTQTPTDTLVPAAIGVTPLESSVTPASDARLTITAVDNQISADFTPVHPATTFKAGFNRIYFFVEFGGMQSGVLWRRELLFNGKVIQHNEYLWGMAQEGTAYFFFGQEGGFQPGVYQIRLFIGQAADPIAITSFTVQ